MKIEQSIKQAIKYMTIIIIIIIFGHDKSSVNHFINVIDDVGLENFCKDLSVNHLKSRAVIFCHRESFWKKKKKKKKEKEMVSSFKAIAETIKIMRDTKVAHE